MIKATAQVIEHNKGLGYKPNVHLHYQLTFNKKILMFEPIIKIS